MSLHPVPAALQSAAELHAVLTTPTAKRPQVPLLLESGALVEYRRLKSLRRKSLIVTGIALVGAGTLWFFKRRTWPATRVWHHLKNPLWSTSLTTALSLATDLKEPAGLLGTLSQWTEQGSGPDFVVLVPKVPNHPAPSPASDTTKA
jgi:hypothetical protein